MPCAGHQKGFPNTTAFVQGRIKRLTPKILRGTFGQFGSVRAIRPVFVRGFAFVEFHTRSGLQAAVSAREVEIKGVRVKVRESCVPKRQSNPATDIRERRSPGSKVDSTDMKRPNLDASNGRAGDSMKRNGLRSVGSKLCNNGRSFTAVTPCNLAPAEVERDPGSMLRLPAGLLGQIWPAQRLVIGARACKQFHASLFQHAGSVVLEKRSGCRLGEIYEGSFWKDIRRASPMRVHIRWNKEKTWILQHTIFMAMAIRGCKLLSSLDLSFNCMGDASAVRLAEAFEDCTGQNNLHLSANRVDGEGTKSVAPVHRECKVLEHLNLAGNSIGAEGFWSLARVLLECKQLTHLDLSSNKLGDEGTGMLASVLCSCTTLAVLGLNDNNIGDEGLRKLAVVLGQCNSLGHLLLSWNCFTEDGMQQLGKALGGCKLLSHLGLSGNLLSLLGVRSLSEGLCKCEALVHLELSTMGIEFQGAKYLAQALCQCKALTHLDLACNQLGDTGTLALAKVLSECKKMAFLGLTLNRIGFCGVFWLSGVLKECKALVHLDMSHNRICGVGAHSLIFDTELWKCSSLAVLDLSGNPIGVEAIAKIGGKCAELKHVCILC